MNPLIAEVHSPRYAVAGHPVRLRSSDASTDSPVDLAGLEHSPSPDFVPNADVSRRHKETRYFDSVYAPFIQSIPKGDPMQERCLSEILDDPRRALHQEDLRANAIALSLQRFSKDQVDALYPTLTHHVASFKREECRAIAIRALATRLPRRQKIGNFMALKLCYADRLRNPHLRASVHKHLAQHDPRLDAYRAPYTIFPVVEFADRCNRAAELPDDAFKLAALDALSTRIPADFQLPGILCLVRLAHGLQDEAARLGGIRAILRNQSWFSDVNAFAFGHAINVAQGMRNIRLRAEAVAIIAARMDILSTRHREPAHDRLRAVLHAHGEDGYDCGKAVKELARRISPYNQNAEHAHLCFLTVRDSAGGFAFDDWTQRVRDIPSGVRIQAEITQARTLTALAEYAPHAFAIKVVEKLAQGIKTPDIRKKTQEAISVFAVDGRRSVAPDETVRMLRAYLKLAQCLHNKAERRGIADLIVEELRNEEHGIVDEDARRLRAELASV